MNSQNTTPQTFRVSSKSNPASVAGAVAAVIREHGYCEIQGVGAGAVNQMVKAVAIARGYVAPQGMDLVITPGFLDIVINDDERTAIKFTVEPR